MFSKRDQKRAEQVRLANLRYQALKDKRQPAEPQPYVIDGRNGQAWINSILQYLLWRSGSSWRRITDPKQRWDPERWYYLDGYRLNELSRKYIPDAHCNCKYCCERTPEFQEKLRLVHEGYQQTKLQDIGINAQYLRANNLAKNTIATSGPNLAVVIDSFPRGASFGSTAQAAIDASGNVSTSGNVNVLGSGAYKWHGTTGWAVTCVSGKTLTVQGGIITNCY